MRHKGFLYSFNILSKRRDIVKSGDADEAFQTVKVLLGSAVNMPPLAL